MQRSYEVAFDRLGSSAQRTFNEILTHQTTWAKGSVELVREVETFFLGEVETMAAKWAASGLAGLAGGAVASAVGGAQATGGTGLGAGLMALIGMNQPGGLFGTGLLSGTGGAAQATALAANTTAVTASTAAMTTLTAALTGAAAIGGGAAAAGGLGEAAGAAAAGSAAGGGGLFSWLGGLFAFARGGIVPSAAGGWALAEFRRRDAGLAACARDGAAGANQRGAAEHDRARRRRGRPAFPSAFPRAGRRAGGRALVPRQDAAATPARCATCCAQNALTPRTSVAAAMTAIFPALPGLGWCVTKAPRFATRIQRAVSGRELRVLDQPYPIWTWTLTYSLLRDHGIPGTGEPGAAMTSCARCWVFPGSSRARFASFLFDDPSDNSVDRPGARHRRRQRSGFQLVRTMGGFAEPITAPNAVGERSTSTASCKARAATRSMARPAW